MRRDLDDLVGGDQHLLSVVLVVFKNLELLESRIHSFDVELLFFREDEVFVFGTSGPASGINDKCFVVVVVGDALCFSFSCSKKFDVLRRG